MSTRTTGKPADSKTYDKELVRDRTIELLIVRLGAGKDQGARLVWDCPECGKAEKYSVVKAAGQGGCLVEGCRLSGYEDVFAMFAKLENLDYLKDFPTVIAHAYELLGLKPTAKRRAAPKTGGPESSIQGSSDVKSNSNGDTLDGDPRNSPTRTVPVAPKAAASENGRAKGSTEETSQQNLEPLLNLASRVYRRILELCPLESRDRGYLKGRGLSYETMRKGRFGTMTVPRARNLKAALQQEFGREKLLTVPGFSENEKDGRLKWTLTGDYVLIPYHDASGRVTTIEGRVVGEHKGPRKYVTLRRAGNHLYLFPGHRPEDLLAVCEGAMGAIVAAECGLAVGAIQGCERFRASRSPEMLDGVPGGPLLELKGVDFGGRAIPYIPDADDPPNPNVLKAAPKAAHWISEPQNGRAAICLLLEGMDLDEWLLSLKAEERARRFTELLAGAASPEDDARLSASPESGETKRTLQPAPDSSPRMTYAATPIPQPPDKAGSNEDPSSKGDAPKDGGGQHSTTAEDDLARRSDNVIPLRLPNSREHRAEGEAGPETEEAQGSADSQPAPRDETETAEKNSADPEAAQEEAQQKGSVSRGARKLRDAVYRAMLEALPLKEEHLAALGKRGVMRAAARVGRFASIDPPGLEKLLPNLVQRFGVKRLLSVPGFELDGLGKVRLLLAADKADEHVLIPCFDAEGFLAGVEGLAFDPESAEIEVEQTTPLKGAGSHLYVFAHYAPRQIEGFCEGPLGALLAAQEDVVIGAIGGFRRYKAASGPAEGRQPVDAVLPELKGVDFDSCRLAYAPRAGGSLGEANARYHEAASAARWLIGRQEGSPVVVGLDGAGEPDDEAEGVEGEGAGGGSSGAPTSLGEWILALPEDETRNRLRELFPESPARDEDASGESEGHEDPAEGGGEAEGDAKPPPPSSKLLCGVLALAAVSSVVLDLSILRLRDFATYVSVGTGGEPLIYTGPLRRMADSGPFTVLYELHWLAALIGALALSFAVGSKAREIEHSRWRAARVRLEERWELHLTPAKISPSRAILARGEALWAAAAWTVAYVLSGWLISATEALTSLAVLLQIAPPLEGPLVAEPTLASLYAASAFAVLVLWRRRSMRMAEARMLQGKIRH